MKNQRLFLFTLTLVFSITFQSAHALIIKGHVVAKRSDSLYLYTYLNAADYIDEASIVQRTMPNKAGNFELVYQIAKGNEFKLKLGDKTIFYQVFLGNSDTLVIDIQEKEEYYSGNAGKLFRYKNIRDSVFSNSQVAKRYPRGFLFDVDSFLMKIEARAAKEHAFLDSVAILLHLSSAQIAYIYSNIDAEKMNNKLIYPGYHNNLIGKNGEQVMDKQYFEFMKGAYCSKNNFDATILTVSCLKDYIFELSSQKYLRATANGNTKFDWPRDEIHNIDSIYKGDCKWIAYGFIVNDLLTSRIGVDKKEAQNARLLIDSVLTLLKESGNLAANNIYLRFKSKEESIFHLLESHAPDFSLLDTSGREVSLSDYMGKVVLLYFWYVRCPICMKNIPGSNKLQEIYKGKNFIMLGICFETNDQDWKSYLRQFKWNGVHLMASDSKLMQLYHFKSPPQYILIDKEGKIREPHASLNDVQQEIDVLLKE